MRRSTVEALPEEVRRWLERALIENNFSGYQQLEALLREKGFFIGKSSLHRHGQKIERRLAAIKASTEAARLLTEEASDNQDARSEAVIALVQTEMFESIVNLQEAGTEEMEAADRISLLSKAAKNIATLSRASVNQKKFRLEVQAKAEAAAANVEKIAKKGGLSQESVEALRREILGIAA
jgi:predicted transposase YdaD